MDHKRIENHVLHLRQNGFEESANIFAYLHAEYKKNVNKLQEKERAVDFYARVAGLKLIWGE